MNKKEHCQVNSGIGGQAVMEGIMMRNKSEYSIAVRTYDGKINLKKEKTNMAAVEKTKKIPIVRGVVAFVDSLVTGINTLMYSAELLIDEENEKLKAEENAQNADNNAEDVLDEKEIARLELEAQKKAKKDKKKDDLAMAGILVIAIAMAVGIFMILPYYISTLLENFIPAGILLSAIEAVIRVAFFFIYLLAISKMDDIQRVYMYHGAEHKCINCIEHGKQLTVENVRESSRLHKRCGTSFLFFVLVISIVFIMFIQVDSHLLRIVFRLILIPVIAGVSYELIRWAGSSENKVVMALSKPGMELQKFTTAEPDDSMIEVGIAAIEEVFDWRKFLNEKFQVTDDAKV